MNIILSAFLLPLIVFSVMIFLNWISYFYDSINYIPFKTEFTVFFMWLIVFVPLTFIGGLAGRLSNSETLPNIDNSIPRVYKPVPK